MANVPITGCSSGIGLETALEFARRGDRVYATLRDPARREELWRRCADEGLQVETLHLDVLDVGSIRAALDWWD
ncbi:MAG: SDR family NAD(P)-dependent oxidoreductase [Myxococcota bacterium]